jgi:Flp pilus assembly protein TadD
MERAVNPEPSDLPGQEHPMKKAMRDVNMARRLVQLESYDLAIAQAKRALVIAPVAEAYSVMGDAWRKQGNCAEARKAYGAALKMNPREPAALEGLKACGGS